MYFRHFDTVNWWNAIVSIVSVLIIALTPRFSKDSRLTDCHHCSNHCRKPDENIWNGITCIDTIGDRFTIQSQLPDAVVA